MTRDEILRMPAGREMDALIAEKVMEWRPTKYWSSGGDEQTGLVGPDGLRYVNQYDEYSTDIAAAWEVFQWLRKRMFLTSILQNDYSDSVSICYSPRSGHGACLDVYVKSDTAPLAICRAALLVAMEAA